MQEKGLTTDQICKSTGLSEFSLNWILDNGGFTSDGTLKALAVAAGVELKGLSGRTRRIMWKTGSSLSKMQRRQRYSFVRGGIRAVLRSWRQNARTNAGYWQRIRTGRYWLISRSNG